MKAADFNWEKQVQIVDRRRKVAILENRDDMIRFCAQHFVATAQEAIQQRKQFYVALSGGSTPKVLFQQLAKPEYRHDVDWSKVHLFWSDERTVPPTDLDSNYRMAMDAGFASLPVLPEHIHRLQGEIDPQKAATDYQTLIHDCVPGQVFDLVMLGMGSDGHTASLFPGTDGLSVNDRLVIANWVEEKQTWRLSFTYPLINKARQIVVYTMGAEKAAMLAKVLSGMESPPLPSQEVGTETTPALWIVDKDAAAMLKLSSKA